MLHILVVVQLLNAIAEHASRLSTLSGIGSTGKTSKPSAGSMDQPAMENQHWRKPSQSALHSRKGLQAVSSFSEALAIAVAWAVSFLHLHIRSRLLSLLQSCWLSGSPERIQWSQSLRVQLLISSRSSSLICSVLSLLLNCRYLLSMVCMSATTSHRWPPSSKLSLTQWRIVVFLSEFFSWAGWRSTFRRFLIILKLTQSYTIWT